MGALAGRPPAPPLGPALARWLHWTDAVAISAALAPAGGGGGSPVDAPPAADGVDAQPPAFEPQTALAQLRAELRQELAEALREARARPADDPASDAAALRRFVRERQRGFEVALAPLRRQLRGALAAASPEGRALVALDVALGDALAPRERLLLGTLAQSLEPQRRAAAVPRPPAGPPAAPPASFHATLHALLDAEIELRLEPLHGLAAALAERPGAAVR